MMTITSIFSLFIAMVILAVIPGPGVFTVVARSMASGFIHGAITTVGIVFGDYIFIILSLYGLSALASITDGLFTFIKCAGAIYLAWLGIQLLRTKYTSVELKPVVEQSMLANFLTGLVTTLSNPKAILFYVSFFPAFINLQQVTILQVCQLLLVASFAVGSVMLAYAYAASKTSTLFKSEKANRALNKIAGCILLGTALLIFVKAG